MCGKVDVVSDAMQALLLLPELSGWSWLANFFHMMQRGRSGGRDGRVLCFSVLVLSRFPDRSLEFFLFCFAKGTGNLMKTAFSSTGPGCWSTLRSGGGDPSSRDGFYRLPVPRSAEGRCHLTQLGFDLARQILVISRN